MASVLQQLGTHRVSTARRSLRFGRRIVGVVIVLGGLMTTIADVVGLTQADVSNPPDMPVAEATN